MRHRRITSVTLIALLALPLMACSAGTPPASDGARDASYAGAAASSEAMDSASMDSMAEPTSNATANRSVIITGDISLVVSDPEAASAQVAQIAEELDGFVESQTRDDQSGSTNAYLVIRVPAATVDTAFVSLGELGEVSYESRSADDVTAQHVDLQARVAALKTSIERLTTLMEGATTTSELLEAESALSQRQQDLDGLQAQLKALEAQVDLATVSVSLSTTQAALPGGPANFWEALLAGFSSIAAFAAGAVIVVGVALPWIVLGAIIALAVVAIVQAARRKGRSDN